LVSELLLWKPARRCAGQLNDTGDERYSRRLFQMDGLSREEAFFLNEEIDRMDTSIFDCLAEEDEPVGEVSLADVDFDDF